MSVNFTTYANNSTPFFITSQPEIIPANQTSGCNTGYFSVLPYQPIQLPGIPNNTGITIATILGAYSATVGTSYRFNFTSYLSVIRTATAITTGGNLTLTASVDGNVISATNLFINSNNYPDDSTITFAKATYMPLVGDFVSAGSQNIVLNLSNAMGVDITGGSIITGYNSIFKVSSSNNSLAIFS
jgi:hypothetical protein